MIPKHSRSILLGRYQGICNILRSIHGSCFRKDPILRDPFLPYPKMTHHGTGAGQHYHHCKCDQSITSSSDGNRYVQPPAFSGKENAHAKEYHSCDPDHKRNIPFNTFLIDSTPRGMLRYIWFCKIRLYIILLITNTQEGEYYEQFFGTCKNKKKCKNI